MVAVVAGLEYEPENDMSMVLDAGERRDDGNVLAAGRQVQEIEPANTEAEGVDQVGPS